MSIYLEAGQRWLQEVFIPLLGEAFKVENFSTKKGIFGALKGIQFDSLTVGGYLYFGGNGFVGYEFSQLNPFMEISPDTVIETESTDFDEVLAPLLLEVRNHL